MALAVDAVSTINNSAAGPSTTTHTCAGSDRLLVVCLAFYHSSAFVSALTYNGVALTFFDAFSDFQYNSQIWYLVAPATGANTLSITFSGSVFGMGLTAISFTGADQSTPLSAFTSASGTSTTPSIAVSSAADQIVVDSLCITHSGTLAVGASQTERANFISNSGAIKHGASTEPGAASTTMDWSNSSSQGWVLSGAAVMPASGSPVGQPLVKRYAGIPHMKYGNQFSGVW